MDQKPIKKRTLLQKYDIPINHLDFEYLKTCSNGKEIERIYAILKSGEEGYFPDLTNFARQKLKVINPKSKFLREEVSILKSSTLSADEQEILTKSIKNWTSEIKEKDKNLRQDSDIVDDYNHKIPEIRKVFNTNTNNFKETSKTYAKRIKSLDYDQWNKYDADTEVLKVDLDIERSRERAEIENKLKNKQEKSEVIIDANFLNKLTNIEKEKLADDHRIKGNDFFKSNDYQEAIREYTKCIALYATATGFCNRAIARLKVNDNNGAINDCNECLKLDPSNVKAYLRKGQAMINKDQLRDAYTVLIEASKIDPKNSTIQKYIKDIVNKIPDLPPPGATRMKIIENNDILENVQRKNDQNIENQKTNVQENDEIDFSQLIIPNCIRKSKLSKAAETIDAIQMETKNELKKRLKNAKKVNQEMEKITLNPQKNLVRKRTEYKNGVIIEELE